MAARFDQYGPLDEPPSPSGDRYFVGVNMRLDPALLPAGYVSAAVNMRFREGVAETRRGLSLEAWANRILAGVVQPWATVHGVGVFKDPFTFQEYVIIAADGQVWYTAEGNIAQSMPLPAGVTITGRVEFTQAFDVLLMHRGEPLETLFLPRITAAWETAVMSPRGDGSRPIPNSRSSTFFQNRLFIPMAGDGIAVSDFGDYTRYVPVVQAFRINQGSSDKLVSIFKFNDTTLVAFKEHSIYAVYNVYGELNALQQDELTAQFGCAARRSIAHVGNDLWFLSELGVMSLSQTEQQKLQGRVVPVSAAIQPLIDRINWRYAANAVAAYADSKYYLAVPLDDAEVFGHERTGGGAGYGLDAEELLRDLVPGRRYRFVKGVNEASLVNGTETLARSGDFTAQGATVLLVGTGTFSITASVREVWVGENNAVLVYDFLNGAWAGYDDNGHGIREFLLAKIAGRRQLLAFTHAGYGFRYEEGFDDQEPEPYTLISIHAAPLPGDTVRIGGGTTITAIAQNFNTATEWGVGAAPLDIGAARQLFWLSTVPEMESYYLNSAARWDSGAARVLPVDQFGTGTFRVQSTDGVVPAVVTTGNWATVTPVAGRPIVATLVTRGYADPEGALSRVQWLVADLQTWNPDYDVTLHTPGVNEVLAQSTGRTKDRTRYYRPADAPAYDVTNGNGDFNTPWREDYSVVLGTGKRAAPSFSLHTSAGGLAVDLHQEARETWSVQAQGRSARVKFINRRGRIRVMQVGLERVLEQVAGGTSA